jgi:formamidopyrimidine-DNA glycosylase
MVRCKISLECGIHPKRKISSMSEVEFNKLYQTLKETLAEMTQLGGRDTENNLFGQPGGYQTVMSKNGIKNPCPRCGDTIIKEAYMGGSVYYCPTCQTL